MEIKNITGYLPENPPLYTDLVVKDFLTFVAQIKGVEKQQIQKRFSFILFSGFLFPSPGAG